MLLKIPDRDRRLKILRTILTAFMVLLSLEPKVRIKILTQVYQKTFDNMHTQYARTIENCESNANIWAHALI